MPATIKPKTALIAAILFIFLLCIYQRQRIFETIYVESPSKSTKAASQFLNSDILSTTSINEKTQENLLRNQAQCLQDFPDLFESIDASVAHYREHPIRRADLDEALQGNEGDYTWVIVRNNQLYVRSRHGGFQSRVQAVLADLYRAIITSPERLPDIEFLFNTADSAPDHKYTPVFGLSRRSEERAFLISDFGYWAWPEPLVNGFTAFEIQVEKVEAELTWDKKKDQLFWRGNVRMHPERERLVSIAEKYNDTWGNVRNLDWGDIGKNDRYDMAEHCRFKFLAHIEGATYSARLKYLQYCNSVIVTHEPQWTTPLSHLLRSEGVEQNVVITGKDFTGVNNVMEDLLMNHEKAKKIARNSQELFGRKYGRLGPEVCYWRQLMRGYYSVMAPDFQRSVIGGEGGEAKDYESVMLMGTTDWDVV